MRDPLAQAAAIEEVMDVKRGQARLALADRKRQQAAEERRIRREKIREKFLKANTAEKDRKREFARQYKDTPKGKENRARRDARRQERYKLNREMAELLL